MSLYEAWKKAAYDSQGATNKKFWVGYIPLETRVYEDLLAPDAVSGGFGRLNMPIADFCKKYGMKPEYAVGFLDGISGALDEPVDAESITGDYVIDIRFSLVALFKKMVEYKAKHLYTLPQWGGIFPEAERVRMLDEQRRARTVVVGEKPGRNEPCPCGSGKKHKKCCGASE